MKFNRYLRLPLLLLMLVLWAVPVYAAGGAPQIALKPTGAAREYQVLLENWESSACAVQFDIQIDQALSGDCTIKWADSSDTSFYKMDQRVDGATTTLTFYCDKRTPISGSDTAAIGTLLLPESAQAYRFDTTGYLKLLDASLEATVFEQVTLRIIPFSGGSSGSGGSGGGKSNQDSLRASQSAPRYQWKDVADKLVEKNGVKTLSLDMRSDARLSVDILENIKRKGARAELSFGSYQWIIDGSTIGELSKNRSYYDLSVVQTSLKNLSATAGGAEILQFETGYDGALPFQATLRWPLGADYADKPVWLGRYDSSSGALTYCDKATASKDGTVEFSFDHFSNYLLCSADLWEAPATQEQAGETPSLVVPTLAEVEQAQATPEPLPEEEENLAPPSDNSSMEEPSPEIDPVVETRRVIGVLPLMIVAAVVLLAAGVACYVLYRKNRLEKICSATGGKNRRKPRL